MTKQLEEAIQNQFELSKNKIAINDQIDKFFDELLQKVEQRREALKTEYAQIETREKRRLKNKQIKLQKEIDLVEEFKNDFNDFIQDFDLEMDFLANKASFEEGHKTQY